MTDLVKHIEEVNEVAAEYLKGKNPVAIANELGLTPAKVSSHIREWKGMASNSDAVRARAREDQVRVAIDQPRRDQRVVDGADRVVDRDPAHPLAA